MEEETKRPGKSRRRKEEEPFDLKKEIISWIQIIVAAVVIAFFLTTFIIANSRIPTGSMEPTIMSHSRVIGSRLSYLADDPERGDVVIFHYPDDPSGKTYFVKRVIGLPGETVDIVEGKVYIDGSETPLTSPIWRSPWSRSRPCILRCRRAATLCWETTGTIPGTPGTGKIPMWRRTRSLPRFCSATSQGPI